MTRATKDFGLSASGLRRGFTVDCRGSTSRSASSGGESVELREANKRIKLLAQENKVLRRAAAHLSHAHLLETMYGSFASWP